MYFSYLLRLWQTIRGGKAEWWASLETPGVHERYSFTSLEALFDFLRQVTSDPAVGSGLDSGQTGASQTGGPLSR
jgi:hypothetical protein